MGFIDFLLTTFIMVVMFILATIEWLIEDQYGIILLVVIFLVIPYFFIIGLLKAVKAIINAVGSFIGRVRKRVKTEAIKKVRGVAEARKNDYEKVENHKSV